MMVLRGLPGAGKSRLARLLSRLPGQVVVCSADDFLRDTAGVYRFDAGRLSDAHGQCQTLAREALKDDGVDVVVIDHTGSQKGEYEPYLDMAREAGDVRVQVLDLYEAGLDDEALASRCDKPGLEPEVVARMRARWEK